MHPYGFCPKCNTPGKLRERRPDGNDICENNHSYPSSSAISVKDHVHKLFERSHYAWLEKNLQDFYTKLGLGDIAGTISCHGDKCGQYREAWRWAGIPFPHGVAIYLLSYERPYHLECRETLHGWVAPVRWVADNYERFKPFLNEVSEDFDQ